MKPTERLLQQPWGTGWAGGQNLRRLRGKISCHQSVLLMTTQIIQELLLRKCYTNIKPCSQSL